MQLMGDKDDTYFDAYPIAHKSRARRGAHATDTNLRSVVAAANTGATGVDGEIAEAVGYVRWLQNGLIGYHIMSHLTPGPGSDAFVIWDPEGIDAGADVGAPKGAESIQGAAWMNRPSWIGLVHELIHGWRLVTGQCVFRPDALVEEYYEEALTVGLPPYDGCVFTENKFRMSSKQPSRRFYGPNTRVISEAAQKKHVR